MGSESTKDNHTSPRRNEANPSVDNPNRGGYETELGMQTSTLSTNGYGNQLIQSMYGHSHQTNGYGNQVMQAMYGYRNSPSIQAKAANTHPYKAATSVTQPSPNQKPSDNQLDENEREYPVGAMLQRKLTIGAPNDPYEQEANRVADQVMQKSAYTLQRKCAHCQAEEQLQLKPLATTITPLIQAKGSVASTASEQISSQIESSKGNGSPLAEDTLHSMEQSFGTDFSAVKVHTGSQAIQLSEQLNAQAFTTGNNIYFNQGKYAPDSSQGKHLLAHELTHTLQQGNNNNIQRQQAPTSTVDLDNEYRTAVGMGDWQAAAEWLNGFNRVNILSRLAQLTPQEIQSLHQGAVANPRVGEHSQVALLTANSSTVPSVDPLSGLSDEQLGNAGLFALSNVLRTSAADSVGVLRTLYNNGVLEIVAQRAAMIRGMVSPEVATRVITALGSNIERGQMVSILSRELTPAQAENIARAVSGMRHDLALNVRRTGGFLLEKGAELFDALRGQGRPTYQSLIDAGKTDAQIIASAARTNRLINNLPRNMRIASGALLVVSAGISIYIVFSASPEDRMRVLAEEAGGFAGGMIGTAAVGAICIAAGIPTGGLALVVCGLVGGVAGGAIGRNPMGFLRLLDIAPHQSSELAGRMYRLEGVIEETDLLITSIPQVIATRSQHALVIASGMVSGQLVAGRGHYRRKQVTPANQPAISILGTQEPTYVPEHALRQYDASDLMVP